MNSYSNILNPTEPSEKIELFLSCRNLKNVDILSLTDPKIQVFIESQGKWYLHQETEAIDDNLNPDFAQTIIIDYHFESKQNLRFQVLDLDGPNKSNYIGEVKTTLGQLVGAKNQTSIFDIVGNNDEKCGKLIVRCEPVKHSNQILKLQVSGKNLHGVEPFFCGLVNNSTNTFLSFYRLREEGAWVKVHETEIVPKELNPKWKPFEIKVQKLCNGDHLRPIKVECHSRGNWFQNKYLGEFQFNIDDLLQEKRKFTLINSKDKTNVGTIVINKLEICERPGFLDYLRGGVQLNVIVAIDFTGSNGRQTSPYSLHAMRYDGSQNQYETAISGVCDILLNYDYDKKIPVFGFGARPLFRSMDSSDVSHCFPANGNVSDPHAFGLEGIMKTYENCLLNVEFSGPTLFAPLITEAMKVANTNKQNGSMEYTILLILTDGQIMDMEETINCLINSAELPLSIIIVGVGQDDFTDMNILDGDNGLQNSSGVKAKRDLVQFVPFKELQGNKEMLAKSVLEEIPTQLVKYMSMVKISPKPAVPLDAKKLVVGVNPIANGQNETKMNNTMDHFAPLIGLEEKKNFGLSLWPGQS